MDGFSSLEVVVVGSSFSRVAEVGFSDPYSTFFSEVVSRVGFSFSRASLDFYILEVNSSFFGPTLIITTSKETLLLTLLTLMILVTLLCA